MADRDPLRERLERPDGDGAVVGVRAEHGVGVPVLTPDDQVELVGGDGQGGGCAGHDTPILATASSGIATQAGRLRVSYTVS